MRDRWFLLSTMTALACAAPVRHDPSTPPAAAAEVAAPPPAEPAPPPSSVYLEDMDPAAAPCADFDRYANGAWQDANPIPASMDRWSRRWQASEENRRRTSEILTEVSARTDWPPGTVEQQLGDLYGACMDEAALDAAGARPLAPLFAEIDRVRDARGIAAAIRRLHAVDVPVPFRIASLPDFHEPSRTIADLSASGLGLPDRDYYLKPEPRFAEARDRYRMHVARMLELAGRPPAAARRAAAAIFALEARLAAARLDNVARRDPSQLDHRTTFAALAASAPGLELATYFDEAGLPRDDLNVEEPAFVAALARELRRTPVAVWREYLKWQLLSNLAPWLSRSLADEAFAFDRQYLLGVPEQRPRPLRCAALADTLLGDGLGKLYVDRYFSPGAKAKARQLVTDELEAMRELIDRAAWMGEATRRRAQEKLATFNAKIGYPDTWKDTSSIVIRRDALIDGILAASRFDVADDRSRIGKPTDRARWSMTAPTSDAYYDPLLNEIVFPAGILQPPAFDEHASDAVNYGAIGVVIGHEISHGFDDEGARFDGAGRLESWWTPEDLAAFQARGACVAAQFDGYFIEPGLHHNGKLVLGESIGDLGGLRIAHLALQKARARSPQPAPTGLTPDKAFFIAWAQFRGDATRPAAQRAMIQGDPHPVAHFRVIGPLSNLPAFAEAFGCQAADAMVRPPEARCEVW